MHWIGCCSYGFGKEICRMEFFAAHEHRSSHTWSLRKPPPRMWFIRTVLPLQLGDVSLTEISIKNWIVIGNTRAQEQIDFIAQNEGSSAFGMHWNRTLLSFAKRFICANAFCLFSFVFFVFGMALRHSHQSRFRCNAQNVRTRDSTPNEEDSIIDNFLTLFHKLCAFKWLTRKQGKQKNMLSDGRLARSMSVDVAVLECVERGGDGSGNGLFYLCGDAQLP